MQVRSAIHSRASLAARRRRLLGAVVLAVTSLLVTTLILRAMMRQREFAELHERTCEDHLRLLYVACRRLPEGYWGLPIDKAVAYTFASNADMQATHDEMAYLGYEATGPRLDLSTMAEVIYCFEDPQHDVKARSVENLTTFSPAGDIMPSSYVWLPRRHPEVLAACPYHKIAIRSDDGEIVEWAGEE